MSGCWVPVPEGSGFGLENLPLGIGLRPGGTWRPHCAVGDHAIDLALVVDAGLLEDPDGLLARPTLNALLAQGPGPWRALRARLAALLTDDAVAPRLARAVVPQAELAMGLPVAVGDYVDCYSSLHHATNLGRLFRPDGEALLPSWLRLPVAYHGRAGTIVPSGTEVVRPGGLRLVDGPDPVFGPTDMLDLELEVGFVIGRGSEQLGTPIDIDEADEHIAAFCLVNDWSARDVQSFEYQPLGPFLGKSFATSMSPWLVSSDALAPYRVAPPVQDPPVARYLQGTDPWGLDLHLEVLLSSASMRADGVDPIVISATGFADLYWTPAQQLAHVTANGATVRPGDLVASGTVSGPGPGSEGSLIELTGRGERPLALPDGSTRSFLLDGDEVTLRGWAGGAGAPRVSIGSVTGRVLPARGEA